MIHSLTETVDSWCAAWNTTTPGCALAIIQDDVVVYSRGYGMADVEAQLPMTSTTPLHVASLSKQVTALCIALIATQGTLALDEPVHPWLPELPISAHPVTVRHLLHHSSGLRDPYMLREHAGQGWTGPLDQDAIFAVLARQRGLNFAPGTRFEYSNLNYYLLGLLVQRVADVSLAQFAQERIFQPLGMLQTAFVDDAEPIAFARATGYYRTDAGYSPAPDATAGPIGAIGLCTTVHDLVQWNRNLDHPQVGTAALTKQLVTPGRFADGTPQSYAWGLDVTTYKGLRLVHHPGLSLGISADLVRFPDQQFAAVCLCNQDAVNATTLALQITDLYLAHQMAAQASAPQRAALVDQNVLASYVGLYREMEDGQTCNLLLQSGQLILQLHESHADVPLIPITTTQFQSERALDPMHVRFDQPSHSQPLCFHFEVVGKLRCTFVVCPGLSSKPAELDAYVGTYWSDEIQAIYEFVCTDDRLIWTALTCALQTTIPDEFTGSGMCFAFQRDADHRVTGFLLAGHEVRNIHFTRVERRSQ